MTVHAVTSGRQCGKTAGLNLAGDIEAALFKLLKARDIKPKRIEVGNATHTALKTLPQGYDRKVDPKGVKEQFMGIPVVLSQSDYMPEDGWVFIGEFGEVLSAGTMGADDA